MTTTNNTNETKATRTIKQACTALEAAGYDARIVDGGLQVTGATFDAFYNAAGDVTNCGDVPAEVELLAVWDNAETRN